MHFLKLLFYVFKKFYIHFLQNENVTYPTNMGLLNRDEDIEVQDHDAGDESVLTAGSVAGR